ncbi:putative early transcription factor small subunit [Lumpy skin disease virus]|uniref:Early transcription factor 70 kDa subunit n=1 Tax=Lumpy skin disease virus TaxID=59509 RepID=Q91MS8_LSDV|nr:LSDV084 putative early transcription factor small subunit [Lumpy skin disease virus NI-2490]AAN02652.1 putative early transcription factor small subunit [Lumpy skin disease virus NW-LW]AOE47660.1 putative early transcription factor small subunit [Lumpy skin disease virus]AAK85045.1 LSDV084 putative early transcription factor small subunit [Lumpy skin disease virus NI-2490]ARO77392.1 putative early transcription factor small subunit [Lumpy skin disease virus]ART89410.1 putative early transcr
MNLGIIKLFNNHVNSIPNILPHQLATLDYLVRSIIDENKSVLLFHIMGSGKTIIALLFALVASKFKKVYILVPNINILKIFNYSMDVAINLFNSDFILENIFIYSTTSFYSLNYNDNVINYNGLSRYNNAIFIIDEAHNIFGNNTGELMTVIKNKNKIPFLLLSGSPITNTPITLSNIISLMSDEEINFGDIIVQGKKVFQILLNEHGVNVLKNILRGRISYYEMPDSDLPMIKYHGKNFLDTRVVYCNMSKLQEKDYINVRKLCNNEMFEKNMNNVSLAVLGQLNLINNLDILFQEQDKELYPNLKISNGILYGDELINLNISSKFKYFIDKITSLKGKHFIYFSNSTYGGLVIKYIMLSNGYSEYNGSQGTNPKLINGKPKMFTIVTSKMKSSLEDLLSVYNSPTNDDGSQIMFLFSSNIMSESYTLKEVRNIWFMTIPDTFSQYNQILGRSIRKFSYNNITEPVNVYLLATVYSDFDDDITSLDDYSLDEINTLPFDIKKLLYLKFKTKETNRIYSILESISENYTKEPHPYIIEIVLGEIIRQFFYHHSRIKFDNKQLIKEISSVLQNIELVKKYIDDIVNGHFFVSNKVFDKSLLYRYNDEIITVPFKLSYEPFVWGVNFRKEHNLVSSP